MENFDKIKFQGTFRNYQQRVLDNSKKYLKNNKIHIVAAPGSGKTILGLELIRRLDTPCIVLSPTNTIRYQWGDRFESMYLPKGRSVDEYVSYDLNDVKLITSITYQGMHSAIDKVVCDDEEGNRVDYSQIDLFKLMRDYGIKTICVDEAHHLQNEWQKALEKFMKGIGDDVRVIALTATPPYDATPVEWDRYIKVCGSIDEEIFVTELVKAKNLCPHQDYVYISYPTEEESLLLNKHKENIRKCFEELKLSAVLDNIAESVFRRYDDETKAVLTNLQEYSAVFGLLKRLEKDFNIRKASRCVKTNEFAVDNATCELALNHILKDESLLSIEGKDELTSILKKYGMMERSRVSIDSNSKIENSLLKSMGKMESITKIVSCEHEVLKDKLRLLILTDFIRKKELEKVGTNEVFDELSVVSIFETVRRINTGLSIGVLSGALVILPIALEHDVRSLLGDHSQRLTIKPLGETGYGEYDFNLSNKEKVAVVGQLFEAGRILAVVGTKSLLGEGWDSPCINALVMASFVGSFMLSNQMRGRAIRTFKLDKNKTANIWHLVTLEPAEQDNNSALANVDNMKTNEPITTINESYPVSISCNEEASADYKTLKRRFDCFVGPHYTEDSIESGIGRVSILKTSYTQEDVQEVNSQMEQLSKDRQGLWEKWNVGDKSGLMYCQASIPQELAPRSLGWISCLTSIFLALLSVCALFVVPNMIQLQFFQALSYVASIVLMVMFGYSLNRSIVLCSPRIFVRYIARSIQDVLCRESQISDGGQIRVKKNKLKRTIDVIAELENIKDQKVMLDALTEFFSRVVEPRYVLIKVMFGLKLYKYSYPLPTLISSRKEVADDFAKKLKLIHPYTLIYTKSAENVQVLLNCQKRSYINPNKTITQKQVCK